MMYAKSLLIVFIGFYNLSCSTAVLNTDVRTRRPSANYVLSPTVDHHFIQQTVGKQFIYISPEEPDVVPNCVATALRAGGYLPYFALSGTDNIYNHIIPTCFEQKNSALPAKEGDIGILYATSAHTLAHMVLFLDDDKVFEKQSPQNSDGFQYNSWKRIKRENQKYTVGSVWSYKPSDKCQLNLVNEQFETLPTKSTVKKVANIIENRIINSDWDHSVNDFSKTRLLQLLAEQEDQLHKWTNTLPDGYSFEENYGEFFKYEYLSNIYKTLLRTPGIQ